MQPGAKDSHSVGDGRRAGSGAIISAIRSETAGPADRMRTHEFAMTVPTVSCAGPCEISTNQI